MPHWRHWGAFGFSMILGRYWVAWGTLNEITNGDLDVDPLFCTLVGSWMPMYVALGTFLGALGTVLAIAAYLLVAQGGPGRTSITIGATSMGLLLLDSRIGVTPMIIEVEFVTQNAAKKLSLDSNCVKIEDF